jgi:hypothetical protein
MQSEEAETRKENRTSCQDCRFPASFLSVAPLAFLFSDLRSEKRIDRGGGEWIGSL